MNDLIPSRVDGHNALSVVPALTENLPRTSAKASPADASSPPATPAPAEPAPSASTAPNAAASPLSTATAPPK